MDQTDNTIDSTELLGQLTPDEIQAYQRRIQKMTGFAVSSGVTMAIFQVWATQPEKTFEQLALQAKVALEPVYGPQAKAKSRAPIFAGLSYHALEEFRFLYEAYRGKRLSDEELRPLARDVLHVLAFFAHVEDLV